MRISHRTPTVNLRRAPTTPKITFLRATTYPLLHGIKTSAGVRFSRKKEDFIREFNRGKKRRLNRLANWRYERHFAGERTYYFVGTPNRRAPLTLAMIDIDCHAQGTLADALAFAELLRRKWPKIAFEPSTNGNGVHGYVLVRKEGAGAAEVNAALKCFERRLKLLLSESGIAAETVEVKGSLPEIQYDTDGRISSMTFGSLAKVPRTLTAEQLENTQTFTFSELEAMDAPEVTTKARASCALNVGSVSGLLVSEGDLADLPKWERLAARLASGADLKTSTRHVATPTDLAITLMILKVLSRNPNPDGSMPTARVKGLWQSLYEAGDIGRPFSYHRFKTARDYLSDRGHLSWTENAYSPGTACKWTLIPELLRLSERGEEEASFADTTRAPDGPGLRPVRQQLRNRRGGQE
jgi:hypothetical protein